MKGNGWWLTKGETYCGKCYGCGRRGPDGITWVRVSLGGQVEQSIARTEELAGDLPPGLCPWCRPEGTAGGPAWVRTVVTSYPAPEEPEGRGPHD